MKILTIVGARPQFIKAAPVSKALAALGHREVIVHTGQHYDHEMSKVFFGELGLPEADVNLGVGSGRHGQQVGEMLIRLEEVMLGTRPDWVLVYGDTNSTLAGALAASKLRLPLAHVEAGLRSFNRQMPEELNRVLTDHASDALLCPTQTAVANLAEEGITTAVHLVGDTMYDAVLRFARVARERSRILAELALRPKEYFLATVHRPYNTDDPRSLRQILAAFYELDAPVVFPVHPRTQQALSTIAAASGAQNASNIRFIAPVGYLDMLVLTENARVVLTDSGGLQKEAFFLEVPCVTLRPETEWVETLETGWNRLAGAETRAIVEHTRAATLLESPPRLFGDGSASERIVQILQDRTR